jgi:hypothetical protein
MAKNGKFTKERVSKMIVEHVGILAILQKDVFNIKEISESIAVDNCKSMIWQLRLEI